MRHVFPRQNPIGRRVDLIEIGRADIALQERDVGVVGRVQGEPLGKIREEDCVGRMRAVFHGLARLQRDVDGDDRIVLLRCRVLHQRQHQDDENAYYGSRTSDHSRSLHGVGDGCDHLGALASIALGARTKTGRRATRLALGINRCRSGCSCASASISTDFLTELTSS